MTAAVVGLAMVVLITAGFVAREAVWLRRVHRASGDPAALERIINRRRCQRW